MGASFNYYCDYPCKLTEEDMDALVEGLPHIENLNVHMSGENYYSLNASFYSSYSFGCEVEEALKEFILASMEDDAVVGLHSECDGETEVTFISHNKRSAILKEIEYHESLRSHHNNIIHDLKEKLNGLT